MSAVPAAASEFDVAIVGGGMVGASLAAALRGTGLTTLLVEGVPFASAAQPSFDERTTALGNASRRIFEGLSLWGELADDASPIRAIHVSEAGGFGFARLIAREQGIDAFGYVLANRALGAALWRHLEAAPDVTLAVPARCEALEITPAAVHFTLQAPGGARGVRARLLVGADGAQSQVRAAAGIAADVADYAQVAVVANVTSDQPHEGWAFERFTASGPLAVLPLTGAARAVIWALAPEAAQDLLAQSDAGYLAALQRTFGWRAGRFLKVSRRASYELKLTRARSPTGTRSVLIGNAAQALHPVAGQGFNLGLRDAAMLAEVLAASRADPGAPAVLERFAAWRARDRGGVVRFTDGLVRLFGDRRPGFSLLRNLGLLLFDATPPAKSSLARVSIGFAGPSPRLARGLPVRHA
ncbi:MAG TPA: 2-octaprenyl-6-methoxyphenyl hydroxylase [Steroidobacteraceae bacterium]|jgi:2-octaprenyl-6-methoxyphenol hydroxylase|nr:2-octaprenyl-6-methoxyphenyl hydroxylase [Steroidobacteraceae bacterium]